ncbi:MAG: NAD(+) synthase [Propionibacteriaceae bacterium]|jgi:NAD+ synthase (glutamine-hydrolysing)|nr:NAD(+) synthase [Propionibacteriaceae bacterium]
MSSAEDFRSIHRHGFLRVAACVTPVRVADPAANVAHVVDAARQADVEGVDVAVFPELCLSGYAIDDLVLQDTLLESVDAAVGELLALSQSLRTVLVVGAPLAWRNRVYNAAVVIHRGELVGVVPKSHMPTYREFYERRWFAPGDDVADTITLAGQAAPFAPGLIVEIADVPHAAFAVDICEDMWVPIPPTARAALAGATVLLNLSGSPITVGRADDRRLLAQSASLRCLAAYVYAAAGAGESSTDLSWDGQTMIFELGRSLAEGPRFADDAQITVADIDVQKIWQERLRVGTFDDNRRADEDRHTNYDRLNSFSVDVTLDPPTAAGETTGTQPAHRALRRPVDRFPFVPDDPARLAQDCYEAYTIQVSGLIQRMRSIGSPKLVIGVSGGLDSTHALIVAARAMDALKRPRSDILAFTLPGFATSTMTKSSALALMEAVGATAETIDITPAARRMLTDLGHPFADGEPVYDVTFENVQAGLRTDYLFRAANQRGGIVVGTGDLSELALGWCTYGVGDQMSHYAVNTGVPKTLIQHLIRWVVSERLFDDGVNEVLLRVLDQEISPELVPPADGKTMQSTESIIGPYALHDFFLHETLRHGSRPSKTAFLAWSAWHDQNAGAWPPGWPEGKRVSYDLATIKHWLESFLRRYFANQFKRSALPNGPKVSAGGTLSPRGDWRMPSDASPAAWLTELKENVPDELELDGEF